MQEQFHEDRERNLKRFFKDSKNNNFDDESNNMILDEEDDEKMYLPKAIMDRVQVCLCYVIVFIVSYRGITNSRFSLTQSKPCIF